MLRPNEEKQVIEHLCRMCDAYLLTIRFLGMMFVVDVRVWREFLAEKF